MSRPSHSLRRPATAVLLAVALALAACSDGADTSTDARPDGAGAATTTAVADPSTTADTSTSADPEADDAGGAAVVAPIIVDGPEDLTVDVGVVLDVVTEDVGRVDTSDPGVLSVSQPSDDRGAQFDAGAVAESAGTAELSVHGRDDAPLYTVTVTVR